MTKTCPECGSADLFSTPDVPAGGGYAPLTLPGLGGFFSAARMTVLVCRDCGFIRYYASPEACGKTRSVIKMAEIQLVANAMTVAQDDRR